jgi:hypothetical protein
MSIEQITTPTLIAAVGNIEAKAMTYAFLPDDEYISPSGVRKRLESMQGELPRVTEPSVYGNYCGGDFVAIGLVARAYHELYGWVRYQRITDERALAISGLMSATSLEMPDDVGLRQVWSSTSIPLLISGDQKAIQRGPEGRLKIFRALADTNELLSGATIDAGIGTTARSEHLVELGRLGIVNYESIDSTNYDSIIRIEPDFVPKGPLQDRIVQAVHSNGGSMSRRDLVNILAPSYINHQRASSIVHTTIQKMKKSAGFYTVGEVSLDDYSTVSLTDNWRNRIKRLADGVYAIEENDSLSINRFIDDLNKIKQSPSQVSHLMHKSFSNSRLSKSRRGKTPKLSGIILKELTEKELDIKELAIKLGNENRRSIRTELHKLLSGGLLVLQPSGKYTVLENTKNHC